MDRTLAAIDVGTNTILLLVARVESDGSLTPIEEVSRIPRLGSGVDARRTLHPDAMARALAVLDEYRIIITSYAADRTIVCGTSAVRDAENRAEFIGLVREHTGLDLEVLSGEEEARCSFMGAISGVGSPKRLVVLDIGGGSTELIWGDLKGMERRVSLDIGAVRLTERCFHHDPPTPADIGSAAALIEDALSSTGQPSTPGGELVAVAGTPITLATLAQGRKEFSRAAIAGYALPRAEIKRLWELLHRLPSSEIRVLSDVLEGRADVITAGTLILMKVMDRLAFQTVTVSDRGLRYGLLLRDRRTFDPGG